MEATDVATEIITEMISQLPFGQAVQRTTIRNLPEEVMSKITSLVETKNTDLFQDLRRRQGYWEQNQGGGISAQYWLRSIDATNHQRDVVRRQNEIKDLLMDLSRGQ